MSQEQESESRRELPIERGFPIERVNEIAEKESRARMYYRPIYTMHKWWARRLGSIFRSICLYTLVDDPSKVSIREPGVGGANLEDFGAGNKELQRLIETVDMTNPEGLWELFGKDVSIEDKKILDPFMGGGTTIVEASRFGVEAHGNELNPVAWFVSKKQLDAGSTDVEELQDAFERVKDDVSEEILDYFRTPCPNHPEEHDADVMYNFWVKEIDCVSCGEHVPLHKNYRVAAGRYENDDKENVLCPECGEISVTDDWHEHTDCSECSHSFVPDEGNVSRGGHYTCPSCAQKYSITDAIDEQDGFNLTLYALEYYCPECEGTHEKSEVKGYKSAKEADQELFEKAKQEWRNSPELEQYVPSEAIPEGAITVSSSVNGNDVFQHGYNDWQDIFTPRQLLTLAKLARRIDQVEDQNAREYLILAFSDSIRYNSTFVTYNKGYNKADHSFKANTFVPTTYPVENNVWGTKYGSGTFEAIWDMVISGVEYANEPNERVVNDKGETEKIEGFQTPIGGNTQLFRGDARKLEAENEYDAVITDPPYYDNIIYSEISDFFYVWQKVFFEGEYDGFDQDKTPRAESIVANPYLGKGSKEFESELHESFTAIHKSLKEEGVLAFTYHHSDSESWGELLQSLCEVGFEVTATYPVSADIGKFIGGEAVEFDIIIVARPAGDRDTISWRTLRRRIIKTTKQTHARLTENRELNRGDIGVIEMGRAFHEYSKHHGHVRQNDSIMDAKDVVDQIYGILQESSDVGELDVYIDLLSGTDPSYSDLNMLTKGTDADPEQLQEMKLYRMDGNDFQLLDWRDDDRIAYIQSRTNSDTDSLTPLDKVHLLRYKYERGESWENLIQKWGVGDGLRDMCESLAEATGDDTYTRLLSGNASI